MKGLAEHIPLVMGVVSFIGGFATWYGATVKKQYAAERDFGHLKNSYDGLSTNVAHLDRMLDQRLDTLERQNIELKGLVQLAIMRIGGENSQIFNQKEQ